MAAVTTAAISIGVSGYMAYNAAEEKKEAKRAMNSYDRQDLKNPFENVQISTVGSDLMREESGRTSANLVDAVRQGGDRAIISAIPKIQAYTNLENRDAQKYIDDQVLKREYAIAGDETNMRAMKENRDNANIAAISSQIDKADQDMWNGISGVASGISYGANSIQATSKPPTVREPVAPASTLKPAGAIPLAKNTTPTVGYTTDPWALDRKYYDSLVLKG